MSSTQLELSEAAKQGNPKAIAALMNRSLQPKGISVKAFMQKNCLNIVLESADTPPKQALAGFTRQGLNKLNIRTIKTVKVFGRQKGNDIPSWAEEFTLDTYVEPVTAGNGVIVAASTTAHPVRQSSTSKSSSPKRVAVTKFRHTNKSLPWIPIAAGAAVLGVFVLSGSVFWLRSAQNGAIAQSQGLKELVGQSETPGAIQSFKSDQENLKKAVTVLESAPKFPLVNVGALAAELNDTQSQLAEVEENIEAYEALLPEIQSVADQFAALDSSLDVGMNYGEYGSEVRALKVALDRFGRKPGASDLEIYNRLEAAYDHYELAYSVWNYYIESDNARNSFFPADSSYGSVLISTYKVEPIDIVGYRKIYLDTALSTVWGAASEEVDAAQAQL